MKKSVVIMANAALLVEVGAAAVGGVDVFTLVMAMGRTWTSSEWVGKTYIFITNQTKNRFFLN
jgi:hypothetical protein